MSGGGRAARGKSRGQSLAEFALAIPLFLLVLLGVAEGGYFVVATTIASHATHEGARLGVLATTSRTNVTSRIVQSARPVVNVATGDIRICVNDQSSCTNTHYTNRKAGDRLNVRTTYTHRPLVGYVFGAISWPANAEAELWVEEGI